MENTLPTLEYSQSPLRMALLAVLSVGLAALGLAVGWPLFPEVPPGSFAQFAGWAGAFFFSLCTVVIAWQATALRGPVLTLTQEGIRDVRIAPQTIPWTSIRRLSTWSVAGQHCLVLDLDPDAEAKLTLSRTVRMSRGANARLGVTGLAVTTQGMGIGHEELLRQATRYFRSANGIADD